MKTWTQKSSSTFFFYNTPSTWLFLDSVLLYCFKSLRSYCYASIIRNSSWYELKNVNCSQQVAYRMWYCLVNSPLSTSFVQKKSEIIEQPWYLCEFVMDIGHSSSNHWIQAYSYFASPSKMAACSVAHVHVALWWRLLWQPHQVVLYFSICQVKHWDGENGLVMHRTGYEYLHRTFYRIWIHIWIFLDISIKWILLI